VKPAIPRSDVAAAIRSALSRNPVVALLGPRQCGKSTLARQLAAEAGRTLFLDLENPADLAVLAEPMQALADFRGLVVLDEVQRRPDLFPVLRVLADRKPRPARFLVLGSASPEMLRQSSETLAGRIAFIDLAGFTLREAGADKATGSGSAAVSRVRFSPRARRGARHGATISCVRLSSAISDSLASTSRLHPCVVSGLCSPIITARRGTPPRSAVPWA
jgi:predicted AAA+ superfamily ATPase